jgi:hypothetical protein
MKKNGNCHQNSVTSLAVAAWSYHQRKQKKKTCNEMIFIEFEIYRKILSHFHAQGLVVAKLIRSLKPRLCTVLAALSICQVCLYQQI